MAISDLEMAELVREVCYDGGTGPLILGGPPSGFRAFADVAGPDTRFPYAILGVDQRDEWETGTGRIDALGRLERMPGASSAGGGAVDFSPGEKQVLLTPDARWFAAVDAHGHAIGEIEGLASAIAGRQVASEELAAIAALPTTPFGRGGLTQADAAAFRSYIGAGTSSSAGTVTSVSGAGGVTGLTLTGGPVTGSGTLTLGGTLGLASGGTGATSAAAARANLGLGTAAIRDTGTSGGAIPILNGANTWSATQTFGNLITGSTTTTGDTFIEVGGARTGSGNSYIDLHGEASVDYNARILRQSGANGSLVFTNRGAGVISFALDGGTRFSLNSLANVSSVIFSPATDNMLSLGTSIFRWSVVYAGTGTINTSDEREKRDIQDISDELLDAWAGVEWKAFRFNDAYAEKGEGARWHFGAIAQQVRDAIDAAMGEGTAVRLGLVCHDAWDAAPAETDGEGNETAPARPAGDRWGLRYDECFALEAAWQRRRMDRIEAMIAGGGDVAG